MAIDTTSPRTRRALLGAGLGALTATVAGALGRPITTNAADPAYLVLGQGNSATSTTQLTSTNTAFVGTSTTGLGVEGFSSSNVGVAGFSDSSSGVFGQSETADGLFGQAIGSGAGVQGESGTGRGGVFRSPTAQVRLEPAAAATHPVSGAKGDLFVDRRGRLWFCKGGIVWKQLA